MTKTRQENVFRQVVEDALCGQIFLHIKTSISLSTNGKLERQSEHTFSIEERKMSEKIPSKSGSNKKDNRKPRKSIETEILHFRCEDLASSFKLFNLKPKIVLYCSFDSQVKSLFCYYRVSRSS